MAKDRSPRRPRVPAPDYPPAGKACRAQPGPQGCEAHKRATQHPSQTPFTIRAQIHLLYFFLRKRKRNQPNNNSKAGPQAPGVLADRPALHIGSCCGRALSEHVTSVGSANVEGVKSQGRGEDQ